MPITEDDLAAILANVLLSVAENLRGTEHTPGNESMWIVQQALKRAANSLLVDGLPQ